MCCTLGAESRTSFFFFHWFSSYGLRYYYDSYTNTAMTGLSFCLSEQGSAMKISWVHQTVTMPGQRKPCIGAGIRRRITTVENENKAAVNASCNIRGSDNSCMQKMLICQL